MTNKFSYINQNRSGNIIKSAIYKWFQLFELTATEERIAAQMQLLDSDVFITTPLGKITNKEQFPNELFIFDHWVNAVHFDEIQISPCGVRIYTAKVNSSYEVRLLDGSRVNYVVNFEADVQLKDDLSYLFKRIKIRKDQKYIAYHKDIYPFLRASDLIHYTLGLAEKGVENKEPYLKCFSPEFEITTLNTEKITTISGFTHFVSRLNDKWMNLSLSPTNIEAIKLPSNEIKVSFDLLMEGENSEGEKKISLSKNIWILSNNTKDEFARVKTMLAESLDVIFI